MSCCDHAFGVAVGPTTTIVRATVCWFRKCDLCRCRNVFSFMVRCAGCQVLVHERCVSRTTYDCADAQKVRTVPDSVDAAATGTEGLRATGTDTTTMEIGKMPAGARRTGKIAGLDTVVDAGHSIPAAAMPLPQDDDDEPFTKPIRDTTAARIPVATEHGDAEIIVVPCPLTAVEENRVQLIQPSFMMCSSTTTPDVDTWSVDLEEYDFEEIDRSLTDKEKINFIINNLRADNLHEKCNEIKGILRDEHVRYLSEYLIEQRVCFEYNLHGLYSEFLDRMDNEDLNTLVMLKSVNNIEILLDSDINTTRNSRDLLKNLGHWLGIITLAKNKPIPYHNGFLNSLLIKASRNEDDRRLSYIIPFVSKILESCAESEVFGPKSQWTLSILKSLAELHKIPSLKLNLQFEIEVLCKLLNIGLEDLKSGQI